MKTFRRPDYSLYREKNPQILCELSEQDVLLLINTFKPAELEQIQLFHPAWNKWKKIKDCEELLKTPFEFQRNVKAPPLQPPQTTPPPSTIPHAAPKAMSHSASNPAKRPIVPPQTQNRNATHTPPPAQTTSRQNSAPLMTAKPPPLKLNPQTAAAVSVSSASTRISTSASAPTSAPAPARAHTPAHAPAAPAAVAAKAVIKPIVEINVNPIPAQIVINLKLENFPHENFKLNALSFPYFSLDKEITIEENKKTKAIIMFETHIFRLQIVAIKSSTPGKTYFQIENDKEATYFKDLLHIIDLK